MSDKNKISEYCIYTIKKLENLEEKSKSGGSGKFEELKKWRTGHSLLIEAKNKKLKMPIFFSAADKNNDLIYFAFLEDIHIYEKNDKTEYSFVNLRKIETPKPISSLILKSSKKQISKNYIRPYTICYTPHSLVDWNQNK